ncbi:MAG: fibronectin/fibrinogen-binding protein [Firmicutes bacterium]|nr:fibronectin/fibrinogen-binding protein [Bacillota bacterium]
MSLDGIVVKSLIDELNTEILNAKIDKIYQPEDDEILIRLRNNSTNYKLLISSSSNNPRIHFTNADKKNPIKPPMFCMLLRKHLQGGKITYIKQPTLERIIKIGITSSDELGIASNKELVIEIMGRHSNIILIEKDTLNIIDSIKRITPDVSRKRQILPGINYSLPPSQNKDNPLDLNKKDFLNLLDINNDGILLFKFIYKNYLGISPLIAKEICYRSNIDSNKQIGALNEDEINSLFRSFNNLISNVLNNNYKPTMVTDPENNKVVAFSAINLEQFDKEKKHFNSISKVLEEYFLTRDRLDRIRQKAINLRKNISNKLDRNQKKLAKQKKELLNAKNREKYKVYGELVTANIYRIERGQEKLKCKNFYDNNKEITINLKPRLTPSENAQRYFRRYNKLKNAYKKVSKEIKKTKADIQYLEHILLSIENCTELEELEEIRSELVDEGYLRVKKKNKKSKKRKTTSKPYHFISSDGYDIYVGKNNKQNDYLTLKFANKHDIWLHTKDIPGSHVIIRKKDSNEIPENTLIEAALLAAFHSKGKMSSNVPVDYTEKNNVKKPNGAKLGMVIYENNNTLYVTPKKKEIYKIKKIED